MRRGLALVVLLIVPSLSGCGSGSQSSSRMLRLPLYAPLSVPDPALAATASDVFLDSLLYSGLVKFGPDLHVVPELAVSIPTITSNGRVYTFTVRQDAHFADGMRCTAWDVAYSLTRALRIGAPLARRYLGGIQGAGAVETGNATELTGVQVLHRLTLRIHLVRPDADFLQKLAYPPGAVVDRRVVGMSPMRSWPARPAGTGAWVVSNRQRDGTWILRPRPHFYSGPLALHALTLVPVSDEARALALYRKNQLDVAEVPPIDFRSFSTHADFQQSPSLDGYYAAASPVVARRLAGTVDRNRLVEKSALGLSALSTIVPPAVPDYVSSPPSLSTDPPRALRVAIVLSSSGDPVLRELRQRLADEWPVATSSGSRDYQATAQIKLFHASYLLPDPGVWLRLVLPRTRSSWARSSLQLAGELTNDPVTRMDTYDRLERWAIHKGLVIPLASGSIAYLVKPHVHSLLVTPLGIMAQNDNWSTVSLT